MRKRSRTVRTARRHAPGKPHLVAACLNAGDCMSVPGTERNTPGLPNAMPPPEGGPEGGLVVGSGKFGTPWLRIHSASLSIASFWFSEAGPGPGPPGSSFRHTAWADRTAGDRGLNPDPGLNWKPPPPGFGSGKLGTPWERMQSAKWIPAASAPAADPAFGLFDELHAPSATPHTATATKATRWRWSGLGRVVLRVTGWRSTMRAAPV